MDSPPLARAAGGAPHPRRCPSPLPDGPGAAPRCLGGRRRCGCAAGGGAGPPGHCARRRAGLPSCAHDGTERRIVRPQDPTEQTDCYSGKKKDHTVKNVLLVNALLTILFLSDTYGGCIHEKPMADATPYPLPAGSRLLQDLGFLAFMLSQVEILMPMKRFPRPGADVGAAQDQPDPAPPPAPGRTCEQQCEALSYCQRLDPAVEGGCPRSGDGDLLCLA